MNPITLWLDKNAGAPIQLYERIPANGSGWFWLAEP
jgi:hypothetical protein